MSPLPILMQLKSVLQYIRIALFSCFKLAKKIHFDSKVNIFSKLETGKECNTYI